MCASWAEGNKRKLTVVGTVGDVGASYSIYEKNWFCPSCKHENYASRYRCDRCKTRKPQGTENIVPDPVLKKAGPSVWKEAVDPQTQHLYYYNSETGETRWDRPEEMGHAPHASGWFGRGSTRGKVEEYNDRNKRYLTRPARKQKEFIEASRSIMENTNEFNIWYGKYIGDQWDTGRGRGPAESKCDVEKDAGWTKADKFDAKTKFFCIHFARGMCARGCDCQYFHRIPTVADDAAASELHDCFGRERHAKHRDDMDGVGSFTNPSRTLYVGGIQKSTYKSQEELEAALWKHFGAYGEVEHINFIPRLSIAFIRYRLRTNCEFAKEAMANQALDGEENLNLKWAYDDPNPVAKQAIARADADAAIALLQSRGVSLQPSEYDYPDDYHLPEAKRLREGAGAAAYPDTDAQYHHQQQQLQADGQPAAPSSSAGNGSEHQGDEADPTAAAASAASASSSTAAPAGGGLEGQGAWVPVWDSTYQAYYYYNAQTQETVWTCPYDATATEGGKGEADGEDGSSKGGGEEEQKGGEEGGDGEDEDEEGKEEEEEEG